MFIGSFEGDFVQFQTDTQAAIQQFKQTGATRLIIDLTNNGGKYILINLERIEPKVLQADSFASVSSFTSIFPGQK